jgi:hypothetical protein
MGKYRFFPRAAALCLLMPLQLSSCLLSREREREPNDTPASAQAIGSGKTLRGALQTAGDVDFYRVSWKKGRSDVIASISVRENGPFDLVLEFREGDRVIKTINDTEGNGERVVNALFEAASLADGAAVFSVERFGEGDASNEATAMQYDLILKIKEREPNEEGEPNDKMVQATRVSSERTVRGFFNPAFNPLSDTGIEEDWYTFSVERPEGEIVHISHSAVPDVDSVLSVYDELGYVLREANSHGKGVPEKLTNILLAEGEYYIRIASTEPYQQNAEIGYLLRIEKPESGPRESEPNDKYPFANSLAFSLDTAGTFNPAGDEDWFRVDIFDPEPQVVTVRVSPTAELDPVIDFFDSSQELALHVDARGKDEGEIMRNMGVQQGVYYLRLSDRDPSTDNPNKEYTIIAEKKPRTEEEEFEPNNSPASAEKFTPGMLKRGFISPKGDRDFFSFYIERNARVALNVTPCALLDLGINLYNQSGQLVQTINDNPVEEGERAVVNLPAGTFFVELYSVNESENSRDTYILRIDKG